MGNMSDCRFENTLPDLQDCYENFEGEGISEDEERARACMIALCIDIACDFGGEIDRPCEEI